MDRLTVNCDRPGFVAQKSGAACEKERTIFELVHGLTLLRRERPKLDKDTYDHLMGRRVIEKESKTIIQVRPLGERKLCVVPYGKSKRKAFSSRLPLPPISIKAENRERPQQFCPLTAFRRTYPDMANLDEIQLWDRCQKQEFFNPDVENYLSEKTIAKDLKQKGDIVNRPLHSNPDHLFRGNSNKVGVLQAKNTRGRVREYSEKHKTDQVHEAFKHLLFPTLNGTVYVHHFVPKCIFLKFDANHYLRIIDQRLQANKAETKKKMKRELLRRPLLGSQPAGLKYEGFIRHTHSFSSTLRDVTTPSPENLPNYLKMLSFVMKMLHDPWHDKKWGPIHDNVKVYDGYPLVMRRGPARCHPHCTDELYHHQVAWEEKPLPDTEGILLWEEQEKNEVYPI